MPLRQMDTMARGEESAAGKVTRPEVVTSPIIVGPPMYWLVSLSNQAFGDIKRQ